MHARSDDERGSTGRPVRAAYGVWINKDSLGSLTVAFAHTISRTDDGWQLTAEAAGDALAAFADGRSEVFAIAPGDHFLSIGDDLFIGLRAVPVGSQRQVAQRRSVESKRPQVKSGEEARA